MSMPPRMLLLSFWGTEQMVTLPPTYDKAIQIATDKFQVPSTHVLRLSCPVRDMPQYFHAFATSPDMFIMDNDSYHYACAGKHVVRLDVNIHEKITAAKPGGGGDGGGGGGGGGGKGGGDAKPAPPPAPANKSAAQTLAVDTLAGKTVTLASTVSGDLAKGPPVGQYLGTLTISDGHAQKFQGKQLGPNEVLTKFVVHEKNTARLLFRPRSVRPQIEILYPEETSLEVQLSVKGWQVTSAYPNADLRPDGDRVRIRWFLRVRGGGVVEDLLTGTESHGLFMEMIPDPGPRPAVGVNPMAPLTPSWPDVRPANSWCLSQSIFTVHVDRVLATLGLPPQSRSTLITSWLPGITRHKNIAYRILNKDQIEPSSTLTLLPAPQVLMRILVLYRGIPDSEMGAWAGRQVGHETGVDWRELVGWTPHLNDETLFRVIEYGAMEVFENE